MGRVSAEPVDDVQEAQVSRRTGRAGATGEAGGWQSYRCDDMDVMYEVSLGA